MRAFASRLRSRAGNHWKSLRQQDCEAGILDAAGLGAERMPVKASGDHEMEDKPEAVFEADADAFAEPAELEDFFAESAGERRVRCAQEEGTDDADRFESLAKNAGFEGFDVDGDIGEFRHTDSMLDNQTERRAHPTIERALLRRRWH